jgi:hypothetical protein
MKYLQLSILIRSYFHILFSISCSSLDFDKLVLGRIMRKGESVPVWFGSPSSSCTCAVGIAQKAVSLKRMRNTRNGPEPLQETDLNKTHGKVIDSNNLRSAELRQTTGQE